MCLYGPKRSCLPSDCLLLQDQAWLNDQVMAFYLEYLRQEAFPNIRDDLLLLDPSTAFMLTSVPAESVPMLLQPLQAGRKLMVRPALPSMPWPHAYIQAGANSRTLHTISVCAAPG